MLYNTYSASSTQAKPGAKGVLIIDDSKLFQRTARKLVEQEGAHIMGVAESGAFGADMALTMHPDLIILDHNMPDMDGVECLKAVRAEDQEVKVIVCSGELTLEISQDYARLRVDALFTKPVSLQNFLRALRVCLGKHVPETVPVE